MGRNVERMWADQAGDHWGPPGSLSRLCVGPSPLTAASATPLLLLIADTTTFRNYGCLQIMPQRVPAAFGLLVLLFDGVQQDIFAPVTRKKTSSRLMRIDRSKVDKKHSEQRAS